MNSKIIKSLFINFFALLIIFYQPKIDALSHEWIAVPKSEYGIQLWDKKSVQESNGFIRVLSKFVPESKSDVTQDILYTMDVKCSEKSFRDVAMGTKDFNEFANKDSEWKDPNGDRLIIGVIEQVCDFVS